MAGCPLDDEIGVKGREGTRATPCLLRAAAPLAAETSFERAAKLASGLLGFRLNAKSMERAAKRLGSEMAAADAAENGESAAAPAETMRYPEFRAAGLPVGSGVVESACDTVAGRLKRGGMRWSVEGGANPILALRCWWLDDRWDGFFQARSKPSPMPLAA